MAAIVVEELDELIREGSVYRQISGPSEDGLIGCGFMRKPRVEKDPEWTCFSAYGVLLVLRGAGEYIEPTGRPVPLGPGMVVQRRPGAPHQTPCAADPPWAECFIVFDAMLYRALARIGVLPGQTPVFDCPGVGAQTVRAFAALRQRLREARENELSGVLLDAIRLLSDLAQLRHRGVRKREQEQLVDRACGMLGRNLQERIRIPELARVFHLSYERFRKVFREATGISPGEYRIRRRLEAARSLLLDHRRPVKAVAAELGYPDVYSFCKQFKKRVGLTPTAFRKQH